MVIPPRLSGLPEKVDIKRLPSDSLSAISLVEVPFAATWHSDDMPQGRLYVRVQVQSTAKDGGFPAGLTVSYEASPEEVVTRLTTPPSRQKDLNYDKSIYKSIALSLLGDDSLDLLEEFSGGNNVYRTAPSLYPSPQGTFVSGNPDFSTSSLLPKGTNSNLKGAVRGVFDILDLPSMDLEMPKTEFAFNAWRRIQKGGEWTDRSSDISTLILMRLFESETDVEGKELFHAMQHVDLKELILSRPSKGGPIQVEGVLRISDDRVEGVLATVSRLGGSLNWRPALGAVKETELHPRHRLLRTLNGSGLHLEIEDTVQLNVPRNGPIYPAKQCVIGIAQTVPSSMFIDPEGTARWMSDGPPSEAQILMPIASNIEWPAHQSPASILFNIQIKTPDDFLRSPVSFHSPVKMRVPFQEFTNFSSGGYALTSLPEPVIFSDCFEGEKDSLTEYLSGILGESPAITSWLTNFKTLPYERLPVPHDSGDMTSHLALSSPLSEMLTTGYIMGPLANTSSDCGMNAYVMALVLLINVHWIYIALFKSNGKRKDRGKQKKE